MEYVIIGACIVVAIAGGIVLYVKNKRTKNELGNTAVVVSKTSSSKLQASEVANDPVIQIGILPADAISDETKLVEITDSKVLAHINNLVPGLAQAGNAANNATQAVKANGEVLYRAIIPAGAKLTDSKAMEGAVRGFYHGADGIRGHANLVAVEAQKGTAVAAMGVASMIVGQYYMTQINAELGVISDGISQIQNFQDNEYRSRVFSLVAHVKKIADFQTEILENDELRLSKIAQLDSLEEECTKLLGQANLTLAGFAKKWDIHSIMFGGIPNMEIESLRKYWDAFPGLREEIFGNISDNYARVIADDIESAVSNFASVSNYIAKYHSSFSGFGEYLKDCLIEDILDVNAQSLKENICIDIFNRTTNIKLIDQYKAFQILSENWETITADLEMIQGEGFDAIFQVDPNMVVKKKKEDEDEVTEVQEGWKGHILPFELVQEEFHHGELFAIQSGEERLVEISNMYTEILESLEEDELEQTITNDDKNAFVGKEVKAYVTEALTDVESPEINALKNYLTLSFKKDKMAFIEENPFVAWSAMVSNKDGTYGKPAVNSRILQLQMEFEFPEESLEAKMKPVHGTSDWHSYSKCHHHF